MEENMGEERGQKETGSPAAGHLLKTGKLREAVLQRSIDKRLAGVRRTAAAREPGEPLVMQDAVILSPFSEEEATPVSAGILIRLAFCRMQNRFAARGALMKTVALSVLLPENTLEETLRGMMDELAALCREYDVVVADGHTEVSAAVRRPVVSLTGIGFMRGAHRGEERLSGGRDGEPKDLRGTLPVIFMTGYAGSAGGGLLASLSGSNAFPEKSCRQRNRRFSEAFLASARADLETKQLLSLREAEILFGLGPAEPYAARSSGSRDCLRREEQPSGTFPLYLRAMGYGGVCTALWKLAGELHCGLTADRKKIPIRQETVELADFYRIDPYRMDSTGCLLGAAPRDRAERAVRCLEENGFSARVIGTLTDSEDRLLVNDGEIQYLNMPQGDALGELAPAVYLNPEHE
ncbi:AIR synthase related protein [Lachnoclostridium sp. Marseille-P6806]|uniref:AIR synthase related protein n=1 Tax=Lachnoclostridium sp. Marseille-P6806 TaxID=2364793 RepID=UPI0013EF345A|nr:AIR synthase related protein [Lachnoclostridium sp. Marseille-P6806]